MSMKDNPLKDIVSATKTQNLMLIYLICEEYDWDPDDLKTLRERHSTKECLRIYKQEEDTLNEYMNKCSESPFLQKFNIGKERNRQTIKTYQPVISEGKVYLYNPISGTYKMI